MPLNGARRWIRCQRDRITSLLITPTRPFRSSHAVAAADRHVPKLPPPAARSWLLVGSLLIDAGWLVACFAVASQFHVSIGITLAALLVLKWLLLLVCRYSGQNGQSEQSAVATAPWQSDASAGNIPDMDSAARESWESRLPETDGSVMIGNRVGGEMRDLLSSKG